ncbi:MAG TPA: nucleoside 2-deoxyribosyltransferase [Acidimicrobiia bacterium]
MQIYFAGSIRGGGQDRTVYRELIEELGRYGRVLTEHVAQPQDAERGMTDREIYERDMAWLAEADAVVAEVTVPSLGVGYELAAAEQMGKPTLCLFRASSGRSLSAMISGSSLTVREYETVAQASEAIRAFFEPQGASQS